MRKYILISAIVFVFILSIALVCEKAGAEEATMQPTVQKVETTKERASRAMDNMFYGPTEIADNLKETNTKGTQMTRCSPKTRTGVERGIARFVTGAWQLATFWYSDPGRSQASSKSK